MRSPRATMCGICNTLSRNQTGSQHKSHDMYLTALEVSDDVMSVRSLGFLVILQKSNFSFFVRSTLLHPEVLIFVALNVLLPPSAFVSEPTSLS
ncbi:hypothetical protein AVEN_175355-1 [Araneus ventricosus]|uniref:Uncharacterized protein n=1 Tax=Araneus ventricosus TaxID=182803 RepID=A0A4Y1ZKZ3_ARAVE|nr:hypothetical protein AVEN_224156-1 [Araneus ventricosus]GBL55114.1 hypothetical protein AVEN_175355-1 [Araneus ventricosus]